MIAQVFNIKRRFGKVYTTGFKIQGPKLRFTLILLLSLFFIGTSTSQDQVVTQSKQEINSKKNAQKGHDFTSIKKAVKIMDKIVIDGMVNKPFWETIEPQHSTQKAPNAGDEPTQKIEIRITYNEKYLYLSGTTA